MTLNIKKTTSVGRKQPYRSLMYLFGCLLLCAAFVWLVYDAIMTARQSVSSDKTYHYSLDQSLDHSVTYFKNSYFASTTSPQSDAYIRDLTNTINTNFRYTYQASHQTELSYTYVVTAHVVATNQAKDTKQTVWEETYQVVPITTKTEMTDSVRIATSANLPFQEYSRRVAQLNAGLSLSLDATVQLTFSITLTGNYNGQSINDSQTMVVSMPLSDAVFKITDTYKQHDTGVLQAAVQHVDNPWWQHYRWQLLVAVAVLLLGLVLLWVRPSFGKNLRRNPYQREIAKIYRYHDGLIIRTQHAISVEDREHVPVSSFDDLLNLSEELRVPIIANDIAVDASRFVVVQDRTIYSYTVGKVIKEEYKPHGSRS